MIDRKRMENAGQIIVLADDLAAESGSHSELMKEEGLYARLVRLQTQSAQWKL